MAKQLSVDRF